MRGKLQARLERAASLTEAVMLVDGLEIIEERLWLGQVVQALSDPPCPTVPIESRNLKEAIGERFRWSHRVAELVENSRT